MEMISFAGLFIWLLVLVIGGIVCLALGKRSLPIAFGCLLPIFLLGLLAAYGMGRYLIHDEPLYMAAAEGDVTKVTRLLASGADPNIEFEGTSALCAAAGEGHSVVVSLLIKHGANVNHHETRPPLSAAVEGGHAYVVSILLQHGADYTVVDRSTGYTPMQVAQIKGYGDIKRLLVAAGATK